MNLDGLGVWSVNVTSPPFGAAAASFAPISFAIKAKENDLLPLEKNRVRLDDDSDEDKVGFCLLSPIGVGSPRRLQLTV